MASSYSATRQNGEPLTRRLPLNPETRLREADDYRSTLHRSNLAYVEDSAVSADNLPPKGYETHYQVVLPYFGLFQYSVGKRSWLLDPNRALFISPGWEFGDAHPVAGLGHAAVLLNPARELLDEVCGGLGPNRNSAFLAGSIRSTMRLRLLTHYLLHLRVVGKEPLRDDEWVVRTLQEALAGPASPAAGASKVVDRAKGLLHARSCERLSLGEIAAAVGVTPVYLTQEFTRCEGIPLYRYQIHLRLSRALVELPHCDDITGLALDLGFSSHSHFTSVFRSHFDMTPSDYRSSADGGRGRHVLEAHLLRVGAARRRAA